MNDDRELTPMMKQYYAAKEAAKGALLLFRMGDFYEMFNEDAIKASQTLNITLTTRDRNKANGMPMAGFPWQHLDNYLSRLVKAGHRVAVCDQMEDPKKAKTIVKREVTRIVTPGTLNDESMLDPRSSNYLASIYVSDGRTSLKLSKTGKKERSFSSPKQSLFSFESDCGSSGSIDTANDGPRRDHGLQAGNTSQNLCDATEQRLEADRLVGISWVELSTGYFYATTTTIGEVFNHLARISPAECLVQDEEARAVFPEWLQERITITLRPDWVFSKDRAFDTLSRHFGVTTFEGMGFNEGGSDVLALQAAGATLDFLIETQKQSLEYIAALLPYRGSNYLEIDESTRRSLEIAQTFREGRRDGTLLTTIDRCVTPMGSRLLANWVACPLIDVSLIEMRQDAIEELISRASDASSLRDLLRGVSDLERLISKIVQGRGVPRDLLNIGKTLQILPVIKNFLETTSSHLLQTFRQALSSHAHLCDELIRAFKDDCPLNYREGNFIADGYSAELDEYRGIYKGDNNWLKEYQASECRRTGISNLRVGYTSVFGFYIEISRSKGASVTIPENYVRKQTLKNVERFTTEELRQYEEKFLNAREEAINLEISLLSELQQLVASERAGIQKSAAALAHLDVLLGLADLAVSQQYCRPKMVAEPVLEIHNGRHPVLDATSSRGDFVPNDSFCNDDKGIIHLITGPNMAGKSTFIRQTALLVILAQIGSFIPAETATIGVVDRVFARVGASDELTRGQSTFMVEMIETARILNNATSSSLVILDEIGRGTSTYDGMALAWAIAEYLAKRIKCRSFFATHYHELTELADLFPTVSNLNVVVREWKDEIAFIHKIEEGAANKSYGVNVAKLAGIPTKVVERAKQILNGLEKARVSELSSTVRRTLRSSSVPKRIKVTTPESVVQFSLFGNDDHPVIQELRNLDVENLTEAEALSIIHRWKEMA